MAEEEAKGACSSGDFIENVLCSLQKGFDWKFFKLQLPQWHPFAAAFRHLPPTMSAGLTEKRSGPIIG